MGNRNSSIIAVIPVWNSGVELRECLSSLLHLDYPGVRIIVADNNSEDDPEGIVRGFKSEFERSKKRLEYMRLDDNYGPTGAMNRALNAKYSGEDYILRIDSDIEVSDADVLNKLSAFMDESLHVGVVAPKMTVPSSGESITAAYWMRMLGTIVNREKEEPSEAGQVNAGFVLVRGELYRKLGRLWSEILFYAWEELDLAERVRAMGYKVYYYPHATVIHKIKTMGVRSDRQLYFDLRNHLLVNWKYGGATGRFMNFVVLLCPRIIYWLLFRARFRIKPLYRAFRDFLSLRERYVRE